MEEKNNHKISMFDRSWMEVTGVKDVVSVDANEAILDTQVGNLTIKGNHLHVKRLNLEKGELDMEGTIDSILYTKSTANKKDSLMSRIFR
jgi:sporulation protein YabP